MNHALADAWRYALASVEEDLFWLGQYQQRRRGLYLLRLRAYLEHVRLVSTYEEEMQQLGMEFHRD